MKKQPISIYFLWQVYSLHFDHKNDKDLSYDIVENIIEKNLLRDPKMCLRMQRHFEEKDALSKIVAEWVKEYDL